MALAHKEIRYNQPMTYNKSNIKFRVPVAKNIKKKKNIKFNYFVGLIVTFAVSSFGLYYHTVVMEKSLNDTQKNIIKIQEQNYSLRNNLSQLQTLSVVDQQATDKLAMTPPSQLTYLNVPDLASKNQVPKTSKPIKFTLTALAGY